MSDVKFAEVWGWVQLTAEEAVKLQMDALACNNEPRPDHGLEVHLNLCSHMSSGLRFIFIKQFTILEAWCIVIFKHRCVCIYICLRLWWWFPWHSWWQNTEPWTTAMIILLQVMYHFANAEGTLNGGSLSCYFGFASDLYHFGHFALKFKTRWVVFFFYLNIMVGRAHCRIMHCRLPIDNLQDGICEFQVPTSHWPSRLQDCEQEGECSRQRRLQSTCFCFWDQVGSERKR